MDHKSKHGELLSQAREQLAELFRQQEAIGIAISKQQRRVAAFATLVDESEESDQVLDLQLGGLTDAVRGVLKDGGPYGLSPRDIRSRLADLYFPVNSYKNFMASLHSVLNRLEKSSEVSATEVTVEQSGERHDETYYRWIPKYGATNSLANTILKEGRFGGRFNNSRFESRFNKRR
jgi:hypothetical protein